MPLRRALETLAKYDLGPLPTIQEKTASEDAANERYAAELADAATDAIAVGSPLERDWLDLSVEQRADLERRIKDAIKAKLPAPYGQSMRADNLAR